MIYATVVDNVDAVELLLESGANVNAKTPQNQTALHYACQKGFAKIAESLLLYRAEINVRDSALHQTPLHNAVLFAGGSLELVQLLVERGADVNATSKNGWTPLHRAASKGFTNVCEYLIAMGADLKAQLDATLGSGGGPLRSFASATPVQLAEAAGKRETAEYLKKLSRTSGSQIRGKGSANHSRDSSASLESAEEKKIHTNVLDVPSERGVALAQKLSALQTSLAGETRAKTSAQERKEKAAKGKERKREFECVFVFVSVGETMCVCENLRAD